MGIVMVPSSDFFWYMQWLPVCLTKKKPSFSRTLQSSFPLIWGSLAIYYEFQFLNLMSFGKMRDIIETNYLNVSRGSILKHIKSMFNCFTFCCYIKFRAVN